MNKILILMGAVWLGFSLYSTNMSINLDFWAALLPVTYGLSVILLLSSK